MGRLLLLYPKQLVIESLITNSRVKRHLISTSIHEHGQPAETKPATAIHTHRPNTTEAKANQGHKLYSKVLAIEPNRLL